MATFIESVHLGHLGLVSAVAAVAGRWILVLSGANCDLKRMGSMSDLEIGALTLLLLLGLIALISGVFVALAREDIWSWGLSTVGIILVALIYMILGL